MIGHYSLSTGISERLIDLMIYFGHVLLRMGFLYNAKHAGLVFSTVFATCYVLFKHCVDCMLVKID